MKITHTATTGSQVDIAFFIFTDAIDVIAADAIRIIRFIPVNLELIAIIPV